MSWEELAQEIRQLIFSLSDPVVVHHYDADGICAGAIAAEGWRKKKGKLPKTMWVKHLDEKTLEKLRCYKEIVFVDVGNCKEVEELKDVVIIDHHQPVDHGKPQFNPHLVGFDGSKDLTGAGAAYLVFHQLPEIAVVGTVGDLFDPEIGLSKVVLAQAVQAGKVEVKTDILLYGRYSRPLIPFLAYSDETYIPGITYNEEGAKALLAECQIPLKESGKWRTYADLNAEEKKRLIAALANLLPTKKAHQLIGKVYELSATRGLEMMGEAREFSTLLNACGRHGKADLGVKICLGESESYALGRAMLQHHREQIKRGVQYAKEHLADLGPFALIDGRDVIEESIIGIVCGMVTWLIEKPIVGIAKSDTGIKVSMRVPANLKINAGEALRKAANLAQGTGGGHEKAAGATIPAEHLNEFLIYLARAMEDGSDE